ncbi:uncharacterized protein LOC125242556 [Leguminivora glycinivorella]|uniref:uncharacterized protein LOC125242556 n=1 Tax=Leguminivora glycinivorella TaxID=1035111 RepID=UPI00200C2D61|nr:uncharacterized protein LOC125242556 [Leguminivora glycinivorella]XP_048007278.1 uncharacterized protein LOC125242556 [Leguminivora glycinivorella]XP_048007279.1 uncharacterized protein LOC125242556 [Leguminivora glycinivorella]
MARYQFLCLIAAAAFAPLTFAASPLQDSTLPSLPQEEEDNSRYKTLEANATLLKLLVNDKDGVSKSEVFDMLHSRDDNEQHIDLPSFPEDEEITRADGPPDSQAEFLQGPTDIVSKDSKERITSRSEPIGTAAGIMVLVTCSIACLAYTSLVVWRRIYLKRNGLKHELLRNEENIAETRIEL